MTSMHHKKTAPASVIQLAAAMAALGAYRGENTEAEHAKEAQRLGAEWSTTACAW